MTSPTPPPSFSPNTHFRLHIPSAPACPSSDSDTQQTMDYVLLTVDTLRAQLMMRLPIGHQEHGLLRATWDRWIDRLHTSFLEKFNTSVADHNILLTIACLYRAFTFGQHGTFSINSDFYIAFTHGFVELTRSAMGQCVKHDLALYVVDMTILVLNSTPKHTFPEPIIPDHADHEDVPDVAMSSPPSPSISAASELPDASAHDSGYESFDSLPSLCTVLDSSDEYGSDSSEDPDSDEEEDALIREGFAIDEDEDDMSDADL